MLAVRCSVVEFSLCSFVLSILLSGGAGGMTDAGDSSLIASLFFINSYCSYCALYFPTFAPLRHTSFEFCSSSSADLCLLLR